MEIKTSVAGLVTGMEKVVKGSTISSQKGKFMNKTQLAADWQ